MNARKRHRRPCVGEAMIGSYTRTHVPDRVTVTFPLWEESPMWVRKNDRRVSKRAGRVWPFLRSSLVWFFLGFVLSVGITLRGPMRGVCNSWPTTWCDTLTFAAQVGAVLAIVAFAFQLILQRRISFFECLEEGDSSNAKVVICNECHRVKNRDRDDTCECGGSFEDFDDWTWIEDMGPETH